MKKIILLNLLAFLYTVNHSALGETYDVKSYGSCRVASFTGFKYDGHRIFCPRSGFEDGNIISVFCKSPGKDKEVITNIAIGIYGLKPNWKPKKSITVGYRFNRGERVVNNFWSGRANPEIDIYTVDTFHPNITLTFLRSMSESRFVNFRIDDIDYNGSVSLPRSIKKAVNDFVNRCDSLGKIRIFK